MPPSGPGICPMAPNLKYSESAQFARHFGTKCNTFFDIGRDRLGSDSRGNSKREGEVFMSFVSYFWPG